MKQNKTLFCRLRPPYVVIVCCRVLLYSVFMKYFLQFFITAVPSLELEQQYQDGLIQLDEGQNSEVVSTDHASGVNQHHTATVVKTWAENSCETLNARLPG